MKWYIIKNIQQNTYYTSYKNGFNSDECAWFKEHICLADIMTMAKAKKIVEKITKEERDEIYLSIIELYYSDSVITNYP